MSGETNVGRDARVLNLRACEPVTISVVIPTYNHSKYLAEAISSVLSQTRPADEIIVIDDGSTDGSAIVATRFPNVQLIRQENLGTSAARNAGLQRCTSSHIVFLDADDRLLPQALEWGAIYAADHFDCSFVYGAHRDIVKNGRDYDIRYHYYPIDGDPQLAFMRRNLVRMQASAIFRRDYLLEIGGYDTTLEVAEDYDLYLRLSRKHDIACHPHLVAEYRWHGQNTSEDHMKMLRGTLKVLDRHEARIRPSALEHTALEEGRVIWRDHYTWRLLEASYLRGFCGRSICQFVQALQASPWKVAHELKEYGYRRFRSITLASIVHWVKPER